MIPSKLIDKLRDFDFKFPNKTAIKLVEAKKYLQDVIGTEVDNTLVRTYLEAKGYQNIDESSGLDDDLSLDDIVNMDWAPRREVDRSNSRSSYAHNTQLLQEFHSGNKSDAFDRLVVENINLVHKIATRYQNYIHHQLSYDDLVSEGIVGLIKAIKKFDVNKDVQFSTYAVWWIRQQIVRSIIETGTIVRIPAYMFENVLKIKRAELPYLLNGQIPDVTEICKKLAISMDLYEKAKLVEHQFIGMTSLDQYVANEDQDTELGEFISLESHCVIGGNYEGFYDPSLLLEKNDVCERIQKIIVESLKPREQEIILERFGFRDGVPKTLEQLGQRFKLTRERIRQLEAKSLKKLRAKMSKRAVREDYQWPELMSGGKF